MSPRLVTSATNGLICFHFNLPKPMATPFWTSLSTITSLALSKLVLELGRPPSEFNQPHLKLWGNWDEIGKPLNSFFDRRPDLKLVTKTGRLHNRDEFQAQARERFHLMVGRDRIRFEASLAVDDSTGASVSCWEFQALQIFAVIWARLATCTKYGEHGMRGRRPECDVGQASVLGCEIRRDPAYIRARTLA